MKFKFNYFLFIIFSFFALVGCNPDEEHEKLKKQIQLQEKIPLLQKTILHTNDSDFIKDYINYTENLGVVRQALSRGETGFDNRLVQLYFESTNITPSKLQSGLEKGFSLMEDKDLHEQLESLLELKGINKAQFKHLDKYINAIENAVENNLRIEDLAKITRVSFEGKYLVDKFNKDEILLLQFIGVDFLNVIYENYVVGTSGLKTCENFIQAAACRVGSLAIIAAAVIIAGGPTAVISSVGGLCRILEAVGIELNFLPDALNELATELLGDGVTATEVGCALALTVGISEFLYQRCCTLFFGCGDDPCCGISCPTGFRCNNGECEEIIDPCDNVTCPELTFCDNGECLPWSCSFCQCEDNIICGTGFTCVNGICIPE